MSTGDHALSVQPQRSPRFIRKPLSQLRVEESKRAAIGSGFNVSSSGSADEDLASREIQRIFFARQTPPPQPLSISASKRASGSGPSLLSVPCSGSLLASGRSSSPSAGPVRATMRSPPGLGSGPGTSSTSPAGSPPKSRSGSSYRVCSSPLVRTNNPVVQDLTFQHAPPAYPTRSFSGAPTPTPPAVAAVGSTPTLPLSLSLSARRSAHGSRAARPPSLTSLSISVDEYADEKFVSGGGGGGSGSVASSFGGGGSGGGGGFEEDVFAMDQRDDDGAGSTGGGSDRGGSGMLTRSSSRGGGGPAPLSRTSSIDVFGDDLADMAMEDSLGLDASCDDALMLQSPHSHSQHAGSGSGSRGGGVGGAGGIAVPRSRVAAAAAAAAGLFAGRWTGGFAGSGLDGGIAAAMHSATDSLDAADYCDFGGGIAHGLDAPLEASLGAGAGVGVGVGELESESEPEPERGLRMPPASRPRNIPVAAAAAAAASRARLVQRAVFSCP